MIFMRSLSTTSTVTPSSRRKNQTHGKPPSETVISYDFHEQGIKVLDQIRQALKGVSEINANYNFSQEQTKTTNELQMSTEKGCYMFKLDYMVESMIIQSPISGLFEYKYDVETMQWLSVIDRHDFRGLVTRDLLRHSKGMSSF